ncbi:hypothetical protein DMUE_5896, partial [Dictyocoela muelleri]
SKYVECLLEFKKIKNVKFKVKLFCSLNLPNDIILENDFMIRNNVIIDFNQVFIKIDNFEIEMEPNKYDSIDNIESELIKNVPIHKSDYDIDLEFIKEYRIKNPINRPIKEFKCGIELIEDKIINCTEYKGPIKFKNQLQNHVNELKEAKIITNSFSQYQSPAFPIIKKMEIYV